MVLQQVVYRWRCVCVCWCAGDALGCWRVVECVLGRQIAVDYYHGEYSVVVVVGTTNETMAVVVLVGTINKPWWWWW